jgi:cysteine desulfurase
MTYLDANATQPLRPVARAAILAAYDEVGNPSSVHAAGRAARRTLEAARETIAAGLGGRPERLVFTSGGTEANAAAIHALAVGRQVIVGATEHDAVRRAAPDAAVLTVDANGLPRLDDLAALLRSERPALVCVMLANNETGVIAPIAAIAAMCRDAGALLHVDAVQAAGRIPVDLRDLGADSLAVSSHKLGGPAGSGAWLMAEDRAPHPLIAGGGQERGWRGGTPPVPTLAGFAAALAEPTADLAPIRDAIEQAARRCGALAIGADAPRLPNTTCVALPGVAAQTQVMVLDLAGIAVSAGAACSSGKVARSHVLDAMGLGDLAGQAIRVSLPWNATMADAAAFAVAYADMADRLARRAA